MPFRPAPSDSSRFRPILSDSTRFHLVQFDFKLFRPVPPDSSRFPPATCPARIRPSPSDSVRCPPISRCRQISNRLQTKKFVPVGFHMTPSGSSQFLPISPDHVCFRPAPPSDPMRFRPTPFRSNPPGSSRLRLILSYSMRSRSFPFDASRFLSIPPDSPRFLRTSSDYFDSARFRPIPSDSIDFVRLCLISRHRVRSHLNSRNSVRFRQITPDSSRFFSIQSDLV